jgi:hypothetical protein
MNRQTFQIRVLFLLSFVVISILGLIGCSSAVPLTSYWKKSEIVVDGKQNEWQGSLYDLKKINVTVGVRNDADNLYLCFISYDQNLRRQIMSGGFTVWFDPSGGTEEQYGIKFPVGRPKGARPQMPDKNSDGGNNPPRDVGDEDNLPPMPGNDDPSSLDRSRSDDKTMPILQQVSRELQFLGPEEKDIQQATTLELKTMKVQLGISQKAFVYELQIPLKKTNDFPFTLTPGDNNNVIGIGFKTEENPVSKPGGGSGGPGGGQGGPPPGGGRGGPPGGGQGGPPSGGGRDRKDSNSSEPIDIWIKATLAHNPAAETK